MRTPSRDALSPRQRADYRVSNFDLRISVFEIAEVR